MPWGRPFPPKTHSAFPATGTQKEKIAWMLDNTAVRCAPNGLTASCDTSPSNAKELQPWAESAADTTFCRKQHGRQVRFGCGLTFVRWLRAAAEESGMDQAGRTKFLSSLRESELQFAARNAEYNEARDRLIEAAGERQRRAGCLVCGTLDNLEFDHIDPATKVSAVSTLLRERKYAQAEAESAKCNLLCVLHHRQKTKREKAERRQRAQSQNKQMDEARFLTAKLAAGACASCNMACTKETVQGFDWVRRDAMERSPPLGAVTAIANDAKFSEELAKFQLLCVSCRKTVTADRRSRGVIAKKVRQTRFEKAQRK